MSKHRIGKWKKRNSWPLSRLLRLRKVPAAALRRASEIFGHKLER